MTKITPWWLSPPLSFNAAPSPHVKPKKSWSEAGLLIVTLVFTLNIYFVFIRRRLQPIKAKGQWLISSTLVGAYILVLWTSFAITFGSSDLMCGSGFLLMTVSYALQSGPIILRHLRNIHIYYQATRLTQQNSMRLSHFLEDVIEANNRDAFPKKFSPVRQSSLVALLFLFLALSFGIQYELLHVWSRGVMVEPVVQCLSEDRLASQGRKQALFWFGFHLVESSLFLAGFLCTVPRKYFPDLLEGSYHLSLLFGLSLCHSIFFLKFDEVDALGNLLHLTKNEMAALLIYVRVTVYYVANGLLPLIKSFSKNFQASLDSYVADALDCKQKGKLISQATSSDGSGSDTLHNSNDKIKYLLKDIIGLDSFQNFLERQGFRNGDKGGLECLLKWYEIETLNIQLEEIPVKKNEGSTPSNWTFQPSRLNSDMHRIYNRLGQWNMVQTFDESIDNSASIFLSEVMERDFAHRLPNKVLLSGGDSLNDQLLKAPFMRILGTKNLGQFISQHYECVLEALQECQLILLLRLQEQYQHFLHSGDCKLLLKGWLKKYVIACLLIRNRVMNLPSEESYLDLISKESLQFVVLQSLGFSSP